MLQHRLLHTALLLALAGFVQAGEPINASAAINKDGTLNVHNVRGRVQIRTWDKPQVQVTGTLGTGSRFALNGSGASVTVEVRHDDKERGWLWNNSGPREDTVLEISMPKSVSPQVHVVSAEVEIDGVDGAREVQVDSVSGDVKVDARAERMELKSVSGDTEMRGAAKRSRIESVSGDLTAEGLSGELAVETVSGDARVDAGTLTELKMNTVSGDLELDGALVGRGRVRIESLSGSVRLRLGGELSATIEAETFSGDISSDWGKVDREEYGPGSSLNATAGNGDTRIDIKSFSGDVSIRRK